MSFIKSPEFIESELRAREQSAVELIAQGRITIPLSARQQKAYDDAVRYAAQIDAREREHYEQLRAAVPIAAENQRVVAELNAGRLYLANNHGEGAAPTIHFASCVSGRHQVDRDIAHQRELEHAGEDAGSWHAGHGVEFVAKWPNLLTLGEVEQLRSYRACEKCNPDTRARRKTPALTTKPSKLSSITIDRIGRHYETTSGEYLGALESYTVSADAIVMHCSKRHHQGARNSLVVLLPK